MRTDHGGRHSGIAHVITGPIEYTASLRQVLASLIPVALAHEDQDEAMAVIKEAMSA